MFRVFFFVSVVLSCLPLLQSATDRNSSSPICPDTFSCPTFAPFKFPFYNATEKRCGLIKINCNSEGGDIRIGEMSYKIAGKNDFGSSVSIHNTTFKELLVAESCEALMDNFTSPSPLLYSISIAPFITLFKCTKNLSYDHQMDAYFHQLNYSKHNKCKDHNFYYKYLRNLRNNATEPSDLPHTCQVIQLPLKEEWQFHHVLPDVNNIFSLLSSNFSISFNFCQDCDKIGNTCHALDGQFQCLDANKVVAKGRHRTLKLILGLTGLAFIVMLSFFIFITWWRCKRNPFSYVSSKNKSSDLEDSRYFGVPVFSYSELKDATKNFDPSRELGDGGFGAVYYGKLQDGREVAVKRLYDHNYKRVQHFMNEVEILTKLRHPNLVVLYGCTSKQSRELLLVYEYIPNGTVADHLHGEQANPCVLTWPIRMKIAIETASALGYLHASEIIHRDVKTNNILLDHNFCVKVADFGLSRLLPNNVTYVSTAPQGTPGYLDPQYHQRYQLTDKSDVYSFGVVLIELISSMVAVDLSRTQDEISLANFALNRIQGSAIEQLIDPVLLSNSDSETMIMITSVAELAFRCLQFDSEMRPTMNEVLDVLTDLQSEGSTDPNDDSSRDLRNVNPPPPSENSDAVVMLKDFLHSPVSVTSEWKSDKSASTTISSNGDKFPVKNRMSK